METRIGSSNFSFPRKDEGRCLISRRNCSKQFKEATRLETIILRSSSYNLHRGHSRITKSSFVIVPSADITILLPVRFPPGGKRSSPLARFSSNDLKAHLQRRGIEGRGKDSRCRIERQACKGDQGEIEAREIHKAVLKPA